MGQYFIIVNLDKKEYIKPGLLKLWEICANNDVRILPYLLATNNPDGVGGFLKMIPTDQPVPEGWEVVGEFKNYKAIRRRVKYFGRWCGDRIAVVGDYAKEASNYDGPSYHQILATFKDITKEAVEEFNDWIGNDELKIITVEESLEELKRLAES